jgi:bifunctional non-homologous end joining protein LigD
MSDLEAYQRKRDPAHTPEPFGGAPRGRRPRFVVQRHDARRLHYDFRLERNGVLVSWAVPKGVPMEPGMRALAVHVEDHPLDYASFAGVIPAGQYGAGTVEIWDSGTYELEAEKPDGELTVRLEGERLRGSWTLVPARLDGKPENWLLIRRRDRAGAGVPPSSYQPMLATATDALPGSGRWLFEVKLDGYRALAHCQGGGCVLRSRNGNDLGQRFPALVAAIAASVTPAEAVIDGEICALDAQGRPRFSLMQRGEGRLVYYAFDCLEAEGTSLVGLPLEERRARLGQLLSRRGAAVLLSEGFDDGESLLAAAREQGLEGVVAKRLGSVYTPGRRSRDWLKLKTHGRQEFVVAGYTHGSGRRAESFGSLVLAVHEGGALRYAGNVGTGFDEREIDRLLALLRPLVRPTTPFPELPRMPRVRRDQVVWVEPRLVVEVEFSELTQGGLVRHPSYQGLRDDKPATEVRQERPPTDTLRRGRRELRLVNLDKLFWPSDGITKGDLVDYYRAVAPALLPLLRRRPFTMRRYPDGVEGKVFFQKDAPSHMPDWIPTYRWLTHTRAGAAKWVDFPLVDDELSLLWMVNMGCIDMNHWYSRVDRPDRPDYVLFDLDPTPETPWQHTVQVALLLKELLEGLGLVSFPKTSGGKGFHILVPLDRRSTYEDARRFAALLAGVVARTHPDLATTQWAKSRRRGVLVDANQNGEGKTIASAYSARPHPGAPVSTPLEWDEVDDSLDPARFTIATVPARLAAGREPFASLAATRQSLSRALRQL